MADRFQRIVVKLGSNVLSAGSARLDRAHLLEIVRQIAQLHRGGLEVTIVTSGAVLAGRERMGYPKLKPSIPFRQMLAAVGQGRLMQVYESLFDLYEIRVAQILLTADDFRQRERYLNARDTMLGLLGARVVPIINENDTVATQEIKVGDNDNLGALVVTLIEADLLVLLSHVDGLYTADPRLDPDARLIHEVAAVDEKIWDVAGETLAPSGTGGMRTKVQAAQLAQRAGATTILANGSEPDVLSRILDGERLGTRFLPATPRSVASPVATPDGTHPSAPHRGQREAAGTGLAPHGDALATRLESRKRWILAGSQAPGFIVVDHGAAQAITRRGKSLLPIGVVEVGREGFARGETVRIYEARATGARSEIARGVVRYSSDEVDQIKGLHSKQIRVQLGYDYGDEVVHHNDMVIL
jgi:glutamate 5-kinase